MAIRADGTLWGWGLNTSGQVGDGTTSNVLVPKQIGSATDWNAVSCGSTHTLAIKNGGELWSWGQASNGRLGNGTTTPSVTTPARIGAATNWTAVSAYSGQSLALKGSGELWAWGSNSFGATGLGTSVGNTTSPTQVGSATDWFYIAAGNAFGAALKGAGELWTWGLATNGRLGNNTTTPDVLSPAQIGAATDWALVSCGNANAAALKTNGELWTWGGSTNGILANGTNTPDVLVPAKVTESDAFSYVSVVAGSGYNGVGISRGQRAAWGANASYALGLGIITTNMTVPTNGAEALDWTAVACGQAFGVGIV